MSTVDNIQQVAKRRVVLQRVWGEQQKWSAFLYLVPFLVFFTVFQIYPMFRGLYVSFTQWDLVSEPQFVGLGNYQRLFTDPLFWKSLTNTALFTGLNVPLAIMIPLGLALLVNEPIAGRAIFRAIFTTPMMISVSAVGVLWGWFLNPSLGLINHYLGLLGLPGQNWLSHPYWAMVAVVLVTIWWTSGWNTILFLAGLQEIPSHLYEAAKIDGAGSWALFRHVTLPGLRPTILFVGVMTVIGSFRAFAQILVLTGGGPFDSTRTIVQHIYETGFRFFKMGQASAVAWVLFCIVLIFTIIQFRLLRESRS